MNLIDVVLVGGGPLDGFPWRITEDDPELHIPYNDEMLRMIDTPPSKEDWFSFSPPDVEDSKAIAIYKKGNPVLDHNESTGETWIGIPRIYYTFVETITPMEFGLRQPSDYS